MAVALPTAAALRLLCRAITRQLSQITAWQLIPSLREAVRLLGCFPLTREPAFLWVALRHFLSCLEVPHQVESPVCLPLVWWRSCVDQAQKLPSLHACCSKPFDNYATFFHPACSPGALVESHSADAMRSFLLEPTHLSIPPSSPSLPSLNYGILMKQGTSLRLQKCASPLTMTRMLNLTLMSLLEQGSYRPSIGLPLDDVLHASDPTIVFQMEPQTPLVTVVFENTIFSTPGPLIKISRREWLLAALSQGVRLRGFSDVAAPLLRQAHRDFAQLLATFVIASFDLVSLLRCLTAKNLDTLFPVANAFLQQFCCVNDVAAHMTSSAHTAGVGCAVALVDRLSICRSTRVARVLLWLECRHA